MVSKTELEKLSDVRIKGVAPDTLPDLLHVKIEGETPIERLESLLSSIENPYCFRVGNTPVKISFCGENNLENKLRSYFVALKN